MVYACIDQLCFPLAVFLEDVLGDLHSPVPESLANDGGYFRVVKLGIGSHDFVAQLASKASFGSAHPHPTSNLPLVVGAATSLVKPAVPLKPSVRTVRGSMKSGVKNWFSVITLSRTTQQ
jgi:hypothetical protein